MFGWISSGLSLLASAAKGIATLIGWRKQASDEDIGRALQRSDDQQALATETQAVNDARDTPSIEAQVSKEGFRE